MTIIQYRASSPFAIMVNTRQSARRSPRMDVLSRYLNITRLRKRTRFLEKRHPTSQQKEVIPEKTLEKREKMNTKPKPSFHTTSPPSTLSSVLIPPPPSPHPTVTTPQTTAASPQPSPLEHLGLDLLRAGHFDYYIYVVTPEQRSKPSVTIPCHKAVLLACSPAIYRAIHAHVEENYFNMVVVLPKADIHPFVQLIRYLYDRNVTTITDLRTVIRLAAVLEMPHIHGSLCAQWS